ncbi:MAG: hypothetical protein RIR91_1331 [Verrucomicrobiota bacterium]|jgi:hypothetical protein
MKSVITVIAGIFAVVAVAFFTVAAAVEFLIRGKEILTDIE